MIVINTNATNLFSSITTSSVVLDKAGTRNSAPSPPSGSQGLPPWMSRRPGLRQASHLLYPLCPGTQIPVRGPFEKPNLNRRLSVLVEQGDNPAVLPGLLSGVGQDGGLPMLGRDAQGARFRHSLRTSLAAEVRRLRPERTAW